MSEKLSERMMRTQFEHNAGYFASEVAALEQQLAAKDAEIARLRVAFDKPVEQGDQYGSYVAVCPYQEEHHAALAETPAALEVK